MIIPIIALIIFTILAMLYTGGYFKGGMTLFDGFGNANASKSLVLGGFGALISVAPHLTIISLSATLADSIFGDHCSPISDTTILSSTAARYNHIDHVTTQMPYAMLAAECSFAGFVVAGFTTNIFITLDSSLILLLASLKILHIRSKNQLQNA